MKRQSAKAGEQGFMMIALMLSVSVIFMASAYVASQSQADHFSAKSSEMTRARSATELTNLSNLGRVKGLMAEGRSGDMSVALYPKNYFATPWEMVKNATPDRPLPFVETLKNQIWLPSYAFGGLNIAKAATIFDGTTPQMNLLTDAQTIEIVSSNANADHPFFIESIEIKTARPLDMKSARASSEVATVGRVKLLAPLPTGMRLLVKFPGETEFRSDWESAGSHPAGDYSFQLRASGIVHYGEIELGDQVFTLGIDPLTHAILHQANNIKAEDVVIGEITKKLGTPSGDFDDAHIKFDECRVEVEPTGGVASPGTSSVLVSARVYGVDGNSMDDLAVKSKSLLISGGGEAAAANPGLGCEQKCPYDFRNDFWLDPMTQARFLDLTVGGELDTTKLDYFEPDITALITTAARGVVCSNMELVGQAMTQEGGKIPSELLMSNRAHYEELRNKNMQLKRFFAYTAPSCQRQLVGQRTECGCFADDTKIKMGDGRNALIRDIRAGDLVWNPKIGRIQSVKRVIAGPEKIPMFRITVGDDAVVVTHQHPFLLSSGTVPADQLKVGDLISTGSTGNWTRVTAIDHLPWNESFDAPVVWNLELEGSDDFSDHYALANGIMTGDLFIQESMNKK